ncbi:FtsB family cell division protein [Alicyclobacillus mengziensis]|uniref:Septum formation initiator family protein n=1 Tax=Alicyclobacillus mengziensis TaxID=2931921 RepID=A0A9X7Z718_9BACL|nr:septum formation initiator family protein [Alicyclobacillus mengziensis]QSO47942.1 septum formation initiator family protein [Alicyclobacillus mengziensis]
MARTASTTARRPRQTKTGGRIDAAANQRVRRNSMFRLRYVLLAAVFVWAGYHYFARQLPQYNALKGQEAALTKQLQTLKGQHQELQKQQAQLQNPAYVMQYAAQHLNLVAPGQVSFDIKH